MAKPAVNTLPKKGESRTISVKLLDFDKENPRFPSAIARGDEDELIEKFVRDERLLEVIESIGNQGYFPGEPLLVVPSGARYTVLEGNRRLAALKLLNGLSEVPPGRISIESAIDAAEHVPTEIPCLVFDDEKQIVRYLGFRHITGIKSWSALQKARYIQRLFQDNYAELPYTDGLKKLAKETGSRSDYVGQILAALKLYETAEASSFYKLDVSPEDIDFSVLSTAIGYTNICDFLGLKSKNDIEQKELKKSHLKDLFFWTFVKGENKKSIVRDSRNLKKLAAIVASKEARDELSKNGRLEEAYELSKGPSAALTEALAAAERRLHAIWNLLPKVRSDDITAEHVLRTKEISDRARQVYRLAKDKEDGLDDD